MLYYRLMGVNKTIHQSVKTSKFDCIDVNIIPLIPILAPLAE